MKKSNPNHGNFKPILATVLMGLLANIASAGSHHDHDTHEHHVQEAHVHGIAELTLAIQDNTLEIAFESPAANLVGFEHKAATPEQKQAVNKVNALLSQPQKLFAFAGTTCSLQSRTVDVSGLLAASHKEHKPKEHGHEEHKHKEHAHKEHKHKEHGHEEHKHKEHGHEEHKHKDHAHHSKGHKAENKHSDIHAIYQYTCSEGDKLNAVSLSLFDHFPAIEKIKAMWISESQQGAARLYKTNPTLRLSHGH